MEPITVAALALIILRDKTFEKTGEIIVNKAFEQCGKVMRLLNGKSPDTEKAIKAAQEKLTLPLKEQKDINEAVILVEKVKSVANVNPEVKAALEVLANYTEEAAKQNSELATAIAALAEIVETQQDITTVEKWQGINIKGGTNTINNPIFNY